MLYWSYNLIQASFITTTTTTTTMLVVFFIQMIMYWRQVMLRMEMMMTI